MLEPISAQSAETIRLTTRRGRIVGEAGARRSPTAVGLANDFSIADTLVIAGVD
jgi:hypothetical protein